MKSESPLNQDARETEAADTVAFLAESFDDFISMSENRIELIPVESANMTSSEIPTVQTKSPKEQQIEAIQAEKLFFKRLCYPPVWGLDKLTDPSGLIYSAILPSKMMFRIETGLHRTYNDKTSDYIVLKIFDLRKKVELTQVRKTLCRTTFFANKREQSEFIQLVDSLPTGFSVRPMCKICDKELDLINPLSPAKFPFWGHASSLAKNKGGKNCFYKQNLWGDFPNLDERGQVERRQVERNHTANKQAANRQEGRP
jgi:hypothetical protein